MTERTEMKRIVIVGQGIAGLTAADTLRDHGFDGELTIVGDEPAYSRPALSKALLARLDDAALDAHELPPTTHGATELRTRATGLDLSRRVVSLAAGEELPYDGLVVATGSRARRLSDLPGELTLRSLDDALALRARLASRPSVVVVGGGPLGMEIASGCLHAGCAVTLVSQGRPLIGQLGAHLAAEFVTAALGQGLTIVETDAASLVESDGATRVVLADGAVLGAELILSAVGDVPNTEWLAGSGLASAGPLTVDARGLVAPGVAAIGDLAAFPTARGIRRIPLWSSAIEQAKVAAGALLLGEASPTLGFQSYFWTEAFGLSLKAVGELPADGEPSYLEGAAGAPSLLLWDGDSGAAAAALNYRIPIPRLRRLTQPVLASTTP